MDYRDIALTVQLLLITVQMVVVISGWIYVARDNDRRERRKELRITVNDLINQVYEIESLALEHYRKESRPDRLIGAADIRLKLERLGISISQVVKQYAHLNGNEANRLMGELRSRITMHVDFEAEKGQARPANDGFFHEIMLAAQNLVQALDQWFYTKYR